MTREFRSRRPMVPTVVALVTVCVMVAVAQNPTAADETTSVATRLTAIEVVVDARGLVVTFAGDGVLQPRAIREAEHWPPRLVVELPEVVSGVPALTRIEVGPVQDIRVGAETVDPLVTRVVFGLKASTGYDIDRSQNGRGLLTFVFPLASRDDERTHREETPQPDQRASGGLPDGASPLGRILRTRSVLGPDATPRTYDWARAVGIRSVFENRLSRSAIASSSCWPAASPAVLPLAEVRPGRFLEPEAPSFASPFVVASRRTGPDFIDTAVSRRPSNIIRPRPSRPEAQPFGQATGRQYTGDPVSMDFQDADLRAVLRTFAEISGLNIVIDPRVDGAVDVALTDVPWDQALDVILRANQLGYVVDGTVVRIAPLTVLADEEAQRRELAEEQALAGELVVLTRTLSYARAEAMAELITRSVLSARGQVQTDQRTNTLIISDLQARLTAAEDLLDTLDRAEPQVEIEARIVQAGQDFARSIGVQWGLTGRVAPELGNTTPLTFPNRGGVSGRVGTQGSQASGGDPRASTLENVGTAVDLPAAAASSALGVTLGSVDGSLNLDVVLSAAEGDGELRLISHPRVTTQNNVQAEIVQGDQIPIQTVANNTVTVQFEDAALSLRVTPQITAEDTVIMQIEIDNDFADFAREINGVPPIVTQRASTTVQVADGDTTVIGGIFESERATANDRVPGLHRIPLLGWLFRSEAERESSDELLIFLTPRIVR